jgi:hypothetical protein
MGADLPDFGSGRRTPRSTIAGAFGAYTKMKKLLLLAFIAVAGEAMAQDAQCVPERAAMVEIIRGYARSDASLLGPHPPTIAHDRGPMC